MSNNIFLIKLDRTLFLNQIALVNALFKHQIATRILQFHLQFNLYQKCISRFRLSTHQLAKETSQFSNIKGQGRKCFLCSYNIDDEFRFTLICPDSVCEVYHKLKNTLCLITEKKLSMSKLLQLFNAESVK